MEAFEITISVCGRLNGYQVFANSKEEAKEMGESIAREDFDCSVDWIDVQGM